jgi:hypothetical protein
MLFCHVPQAKTVIAEIVSVGCRMRIRQVPESASDVCALAVTTFRSCCRNVPDVSHEIAGRAVGTGCIRLRNVRSGNLGFAGLHHGRAGSFAGRLCGERQSALPG